MADLIEVNEKAMPKSSDDEKAGIESPLPVPVLAKAPDGSDLQPQPVPGDPLDPLNWSSVQKHVILAIVMAL